MRTVQIVGLLLLSMVLLIGQGCKNSYSASCPLCARPIHKGMKATLAFEGKSQTTCCIACAEHYKNTHKSAEIRTVTDFNNAKQLDAGKAVLVYGSDIPGCSEPTATIRTPDAVLQACYDRCQPSVLAFGNRTEAEALQRAHGGKIYTLAELDRLFAASIPHH